MEEKAVCRTAVTHSPGNQHGGGDVVDGGGGRMLDGSVSPGNQHGGGDVCRTAVSRRTGEERRSGYLTRWRRWQRRSRTGIARHDFQPSLCHWFSCSTATLRRRLSFTEFLLLRLPPQSRAAFQYGENDLSEFSEVGEVSQGRGTMIVGTDSESWSGVHL